jgi:hypothetical protein
MTARYCVWLLIEIGGVKMPGFGTWIAEVEHKIL